jgi:hypothetical protein
MKRLPVLLLACCAAPRTRAEDAVKLSDLDWSSLTAAIAEGRTISGVRACKVKGGSAAEEIVYPLHLSGSTPEAASTAFRKIRKDLGFSANPSGHPPFIDQAQLGALPKGSWFFVIFF